MVTTSAGRLLRIIQLGDAYRYVNEHRTEETVGRVLAKVVDLPLEDNLGVSRLFGQILQMPADIRDDLVRIRGARAQNYVGVLDSIARGLKNVKPEDSWGHMMNVFPEANRSGLAMAADILEDGYAEADINKEQLAAWRDQVGDLIIEIAEADIDNELKRQLIELLEEFIVAICNYLAFGPRGLKKISQRVFGFGFLRNLTHPNMNSQDREAIHDTVSLAANIVTVIEGVASAVPTLAAITERFRLMSGN